MEHRWGERVAVRLTVELSSGASPPVAGSLENVSSSGAFVRTARRGPPRGPVEVMLEQRASGRAHCVRLPAYVVRETETGVGIEWCEFAPRAVRELMVRDRRTGGARTGSRALSPTRRSPHTPDTLTQPLAQSAAEPAAISTTGLATDTLPVTAFAAAEWACGAVR
ncbi:MAG: PilZ domain-containing protein [Steroidobacteraceae bacterium]